MKKTLLIIAALLGLGFNGRLWAHDDMMKRPAASTEFELVKKLAGAWKGEMTHPGTDEKSKPVSTKFRVTSAGSAVEETLMPGTPHEMVNMYSDEAGKLAFTHYCAMGNHPHMLLKKSGASSLVLEMGPTPGIDADKDAHMHALTLEFPDSDHLTERWTSYKDGKPAETVVFQMTRAPE